MMTKLYVTVILLYLSFNVIADQSQPAQEYILNPNTEQISQSGCCSHNGGVCGCDGGRAVCCDGKYSPSCGCHANDIKEFLKSNEAEQPKS